MKKIIFLMFALSAILSAQTFTVIEVRGNAKSLGFSNEQWVNLEEGTILNSSAIITTADNSSVKLKGSDGERFLLKEYSTLSVSDIRKMSFDDFLLALAMGDILKISPEKENKKANSTVVYGTKADEGKISVIKDDDFGIKRLNGAVQLSESGYEQSAVIAARETYRKYPAVEKIPFYRIYFANILFNKGLYETAYNEFSSINELALTGSEKEQVTAQINQLKKKIGNLE